MSDVLVIRFDLFEHLTEDVSRSGNESALIISLYAQAKACIVNKFRRSLTARVAGV